MDFPSDVSRTDRSIIAVDRIPGLTLLDDGGATSAMIGTRTGIRFVGCRSVPDLFSITAAGDVAGFDTGDEQLGVVRMSDGRYFCFTTRGYDLIAADIGSAVGWLTTALPPGILMVS